MAKSGVSWIAGAALLTAVIYGGQQLYRAWTARKIDVCLVTDTAFRLQRNDWEASVKLWLAEANRVFEPTGVQFAVSSAASAYEDGTPGSLLQRRMVIDQSPPCTADLILGFSGAPDVGSRASVGPFGNVALIGTDKGDSDTNVFLTVSRALLTLFGAPVNIDAVITTENPQNEVADAATIKLVRTLRDYPFSTGIADLPGRWEKRALAAISEALSGKTENPVREAHRTLARAFASGRQYSPAVDHLQEAVRLSPRDARLRMEFALTLEDDSRGDAAINELKEAARLDADDARPHALLGVIYTEKRRLYEAIDEFRQAIARDPSSAEYFTALGAALSQQAGRSAEARAAYEAAVRLNGRSWKAIQGLDTLQRAQRLSEDQLRVARATASATPGNADAQFELGLAEVQAGDLDRAWRSFERVLSIDPRHGQAHLALARLSLVAGQYVRAERELAAARASGVPVPAGFSRAVELKLGPTPSSGFPKWVP